MIKLNVPDMHCGKCVERIQNALKAENIACTVSLEEKAVYIDGCENCAKTATTVLDDIGFPVQQ